MRLHRALARSSTALGLLLATSVSAFATDGYFQNGYGARQKALAGAGVADSRDATAGSLNPAGLVHVGDEISLAVSVFSPHRTYTGSGTPGFAPQGEVESEWNYFFIPNLAWNTRAFANPLFDTFGLVAYGNGGMNTHYPAFPRPAPDCAPSPVGGSGIFCGGESGINLTQMFISATMAKQVAPGISIGLAPTLVYQQISIDGLAPFAGFSTDPIHVTGNGNDSSYGGGVRGGIEFAPMSNVRIGVAGATPMWMSKFGDYAGLFAEGGKFDIPANVSAGIAVDVTPGFTVMLDYKHIFYSSIDAIANPSTNLLACAGGDPTQCLGGSKGPGFGWDDIDVVKVGMEYRPNPGMALRAGYSWNSSPLNARDVHFNILAPATVQHHITAGLSMDIGGGYTFELAGMYAPNVSLSGQDLLVPTHNIEIEMYQYEVTEGIKYKFGGPSEPLK